MAIIKAISRNWNINDIILTIDDFHNKKLDPAMVKAVIFDLDDTLYDEISYCKSGFDAVAECLSQSHLDLNKEQVFDAFWDEFCNGDKTKVFNHGLSRVNINPDRHLVKSLVEVYRQHRPEMSLPKESKAVLKILSGNYKLGLLSDGFLPAQELKVEVLGIAKYFQAIVYTEALGREFWKPSTVGFEKICKDLQVEASECVYIADNVAKDFYPANKLGFASSIQLVSSKGVHKTRLKGKDYAAKVKIESLSQLPELLKTL